MKKTSAYARKKAHQTAWDRQRHEVMHPVAEAVVKSRIEADIQRLRTDTALHAYAGDDAARIASMAGRLVFMATHAAVCGGLDREPEFDAITLAASALATLATTRDDLDAQRDSVIAGLQAIELLMPRLSALDLAWACQELDGLCDTARDMSTDELSRALGLDKQGTTP